MTDPYDPYRQNDPYGPPGQQPYGQGPYGPQPPGGPYQGQPGGPYQGGTPYQQPDATRQFDPYGTRQFDPYGTPQFDTYGAPQQPYQGSYGQPAGWGPGPGGPGGPGGFPPQPPKKSKAPVIALAVLGALVLIGGVVVVAIAVRANNNPAVAGPTTTASASGRPASTSRRPTSTRPPTTTASEEDFAVGQCATLTPEDNNRATIQATECGGLLSDVVIDKIQSDECVQPYLSFNPGHGKVYCLAMDAKEGDCFRFDKLIKRAIACAGDGTRKVVKIFEGVADENQCAGVPDLVDTYAYPDPPRTLCLTNA